jgi:hypothetical protein
MFPVAVCLLFEQCVSRREELQERNVEELKETLAA